ncbi:LOW QUALITY PROTEIN: hypothetical protein QYF61_004534 [Mycteria americana]|uniref:Uncharacterized protein n=1 Tax=Mycteria americana TaxID=33587 RepID=A0AAN7RVQ4_MYCAM|nr:LOW QUALITY PROTEIN: hypothetical protein QYF61_004534 [Mycteria americana]
MLPFLPCGQRTLEWPWSQARVKYTGSMGIHSSKGDLKLSTVVMHGTETVEPSTTSALTVKDEKILSPQISEVGPYVIKNTGQQQVLFNPSWSLKRVELLMQINTSAIKPTCSPFLGTSYAGWLAWLHGRTLTSPRRTRRDVTGIIGTGLGVLNSIDAEVLINKLSATTSDLNKLEHPLRSSLLALGTNQWLLSDILPQWKRINERDHQLIVDALGVAQTNVSLALSCIQAQLWMQSMVAAIIREGEEGTLPTEIRRKGFQSCWYLVNFTYDPINNKATAFVLTIHNASVYTIYPIIALGLNHNGTILYPLEHRVWAQRNGNKWQTVDVNACVVREQQGFICESNTLKAQDICLDTEQNVCHFEIRPYEVPETVLVYIGKGCVCMRTLCDFIFVDNITIQAIAQIFVFVCNFTKIVGCDFNYPAPVTSYQLLQSNYTLSQDLLPTPIGMNLTLVKKLLQHDDLCQLLERIRNNGHKTPITVHHDAEEIHHVLERVKKDGEHHWWETLLGWSPTAMGVFNLMLHPVVILLTLTLQKSARLERKDERAGPSQGEEEEEEELVNETESTRSLSLSELRDMRKYFSRRPGEHIATWLLRCWDSGASSLEFEGKEAKQLGSISREGGIDKVIGKEEPARSLWSRLLSAIKDRYPFKEDVVYRPGKWTTMERGIQYLRELAVLEVIYGDLDDVRSPTDPDEVQCTRPMWRKLVRNAPPSCANSLAILTWRDGDGPTVNEAASNLREYEESISSSLVSAVEKLSREFQRFK